MKKKLNDSTAIYKYYKTHPRDRFELWIDLHNHKFELVRTIASLLAFIIQTLTLLRVFGKI